MPVTNQQLKEFGIPEDALVLTGAQAKMNIDTSQVSSGGRWWKIPPGKYVFKVIVVSLEKAAQSQYPNYVFNCEITHSDVPGMVGKKYPLAVTSNPKGLFRLVEILSAIGFDIPRMPTVQMDFSLCEGRSFGVVMEEVPSFSNPQKTVMEATHLFPVNQWNSIMSPAQAAQQVTQSAVPQQPQQVNGPQPIR